MKNFVVQILGFAEGRRVEIQALNLQEASHKIKQKFRGKHGGFIIWEIAS